MVVIYRADDGTEFDSEELCQAYEEGPYAFVRQQCIAHLDDARLSYDPLFRRNRRRPTGEIRHHAEGSEP